MCLGSVQCSLFRGMGSLSPVMMVMIVDDGGWWPPPSLQYCSLSLIIVWCLSLASEGDPSHTSVATPIAPAPDCEPSNKR